MIYQQTPDSFSYRDLIIDILAHAHNGSKEVYCRVGQAGILPLSFKAINFLNLNKNIAIYIPRIENVTRNTILSHFVEHLEHITNGTSSFYITKEEQDAYGLEDVFAIRIINVMGQITDTFETAIPTYARENGATELLNVSLALKLSPKHRVRVYLRNNNIIVFTTKGVTDAPETDYLFYRKLYACIPYIRGWQDTKPELTQLYKSLDNEDATSFWTLLEHMYSTDETLKDLKYKRIIDGFNNISNIQLNTYIRECDNLTVLLDRILAEYNDALKKQRSYERKILEYNNLQASLTPEQIKILFDKKIVYNLDTSHLSSTQHPRIAYRCSAFCLNYDREAAAVYFNKHIKGNFDDKFETLFKLIFLDEKVLLNFDEAIVIDFKEYTINARDGHNIIGNDYNNCFPNTHHANYNCWGSYGPALTKLISQFKLEELFYQIKTAVSSLNFVDYTVMSRFVRHLYDVTQGHYNPACFYWRDENCTTAHTFEETLKHFTEEVTK